MSNENIQDQDKVGIEEALNANSPEKERKFLIQQIVQVKERLDNGISDRVEKNSNFRENLTRGLWVSLPTLLAMLGTMLWFIVVRL